MIKKKIFIAACKEIEDQISKMSSSGQNIVCDGVIDPERYFNLRQNGNPRLLWLLKEANSDENWSFQDAFQNEEWLIKCNALSSIRRIIYTSYGILHSRDQEWHEFPFAYEDICYGAMRDIGLVNIKKVPGGNTSDDDEINEAYSINRELLKNQFMTYDPDIIIFGNTMKYVCSDDFDGLKNAKKEVSEFRNHYYNAGNKLYINAWHPACRGRGFTDAGYVMDIVKIVRHWESVKGK